MQRKLLLIFILTLFHLLFASNQSKGKSGLTFLKIGIDARAVGMGEAYTAVAENAAAVYWNPAGLMNAPRSNVLFNHNEWIQDLRGEFVALSIVGNKSAWGFHLRSFNISDIEVREIPTAEPLEKASAHYISAGISYARRMYKSLDLGVTLKYLYEKIFVTSASGFATDFGVLYRPPVHNLSIGLSFQNFGKMQKFENEETTLPVIGRLGVKYQIPVDLTITRVILAADVVKPVEENAKFNLGTELTLWKYLAVRVGYFIGYEARDFSLGLGFMRSAIRLDYGIVPFGDDLGSTHRFTLNFNI